MRILKRFFTKAKKQPRERENKDLFIDIETAISTDKVRRFNRFLELKEMSLTEGVDFKKESKKIYLNNKLIDEFIQWQKVNRVERKYTTYQILVLRENDSINIKVKMDERYYRGIKHVIKVKNNNAQFERFIRKSRLIEGIKFDKEESKVIPLILDEVIKTSKNCTGLEWKNIDEIREENRGKIIEENLSESVFFNPMPILRESNRTNRTGVKGFIRLKANQDFKKGIDFEIKDEVIHLHQKHKKDFSHWLNLNYGRGKVQHAQIIHTQLTDGFHLQVRIGRGYIKGAFHILKYKWDDEQKVKNGLHNWNLTRLRKYDFGEEDMAFFYMKRQLEKCFKQLAIIP